MEDESYSHVVKIATAAGKVASGLTAKATTDNSAVDVIAVNSSRKFHHLRIFNTGGVAGFYSIDGGTTWEYLPANTILTDDWVGINNKAVQIKRVADGANVTGVYASVW